MRHKLIPKPQISLFNRALSLFLAWSAAIHHVKCISPNPFEPYVALQLITDDGGNSHKRTIKVVEARAAAGSTADDPVEESLEGYTIVYNSTSKQYQYAELDSITGDFKASGFPLRRGQPPPSGQFQKHLQRTAAGRAKVALQRDGGTRRILSSLSPAKHVSDYPSWNSHVENWHRNRHLLKLNSTLNTLVIPMVFSNHVNRWKPTKESLSTLFNAVGGDTDIAPTGSLRDVFKMISHGKLDLTATVLDWVVLSKPESYYAAENRGYTASFMHEAIKEALDYLEKNLKLDFSQYDSNKDGLIDSIAFLHSGYGAEFGGVSEDGAYWMRRIWSHKSSLWTLNGGDGWKSATHNVKVYNYQISTSIWGILPSSYGSLTKHKITRIGVLAHETAHFLGLPALYDIDYADPGHGMGKWGLMGSAWGFDNDQRCVPLLDPWSKIQLGWIEPVEITRADSGKNMTLSPSYAMDANYYIVKEGFPQGEYLLLEYRKRQANGEIKGEYCLPVEGGLAVWKIDEKTKSLYKQGWPGQLDNSTGLEFPYNGNHYSIALLQADGSYDLEQGHNGGDTTDLFSRYSVNFLLPGIMSFISGSEGIVYPNTDSYQGGKVYSTGLGLLDIQEGTDSLSFQVQFSDPTLAPTISMAPTISHAPAAVPTNPPTLSPTNFPTVSRSPTKSPTMTPTISAAPTFDIAQSCSEPGEKLFQLELTTDSHGDEVTWELIDAKRGPEILRKGGSYWRSQHQNTLKKYGICLQDQSCYSFVIKDSAGNGGTMFKATYNGQTVLESAPGVPFRNLGGDFGDLCRLGSNQPVYYLGKSGKKLVSSVMFDILAVQTSINIKRFTGLHVASAPNGGSVKLKIYSKNGSFRGFETKKEAWQLVMPEMNFVPAGEGSYTGTVNLNEPYYAPIMKGTTQAFYFEFDQPVLLVNELADYFKPGESVFLTEPPFQVIAGIESKANFGGRAPYSLPMGVDGRIVVAHLDIEVKATNRPTASPTSSPSAIPSATPSARPSSKPTAFATNSPTKSLVQCPAGQELLIVEVETDDKGSETTWSLTNVYQGKHLMESKGPYTDERKYYRYQYCLPDNSCYKWVIKDSAGDGILGYLGTGFRVKWKNQIQIDTMSNNMLKRPFTADGVDFGSYCRRDITFGTSTIGRPGTTASAGIMFDLVAKQDVMLMRFAALHVQGTTSYNFKIYTKNGSYKGYETDPSAWTLQKQQTEIGAGAAGYTILTNFDNAVPIMGGTRQAIYIEANPPNLLSLLRDPKDVNTAYKTLDGVDFNVGVLVNAGFGGPTGQVGQLDGKVLFGSVVVVYTSVPTKSPSKTPSASPSAKPSASPVTSPSASPTKYTTDPPTSPPKYCPIEGEEQLIIEVETDDKGSENSWKLSDVYNGGVILKSQGPYNDERKFYRYQYCLPEASCYKWVLSDSSGNGMLGVNGSGFRVQWKNKVETDTMNMGMLKIPFTQDGIDFGSRCNRDVAKSTPTIGRPGITTSAGIMFDMVSKQDVVLMRFAGLHLQDTSSYTIKIWSKNGSYQGYQTDATAWTLVSIQTLVGGGSSAYTNTSNFPAVVPMLAGTRQAFYIEVNPPTLLSYSRAAQDVNTIFKSFTEADVYVGVLVKSDFGGPTGGVAQVDGRLAFGTVIVKTV